MRIGEYDRADPHKLVVKCKKVVRVGNALYVSIPKEFATRYRLSKGSTIAVIINDRMQIVVP